MVIGKFVVESMLLAGAAVATDGNHRDGILNRPLPRVAQPTDPSSRRQRSVHRDQQRAAGLEGALGVPVGFEETTMVGIPVSGVLVG